MVRSAVRYSLGLALLIMPSVVMGQQNSVTHKWKFPTTINAPWAMEDDQKPLDTPSSAAGLCRSTPFNTTGAYGPLGTNVDAIVGDALNNSGFSNLGCTTAQNETTIAVNPTNSQNLIAGANDYRVCCDFTGLNDATGWAYFSFDGGATWKAGAVAGAEQLDFREIYALDQRTAYLLSSGPGGYSVEIPSRRPSHDRRRETAVPQTPSRNRYR